ncbi:MAG: hypothetical protein H6Q31_2071 [Bacteroidetes bacterium]|jgi:hypothetical protein|nr:hypothetical protein [Bacteroidota bacterium]
MSIARNNETLSLLSEHYVRLVLALGLHDADYVDAYYGPPEWKAAVEREHPGLDEIAGRAGALINGLRELSLADAEEMIMLRHRYLLRQSESLVVRVTMLKGKKRSFDEEAQALYDAVPPTLPEEHFAALLKNVGDILPGTGDVPARYQEYQKRFVIPKHLLDRVFGAAIAEGRRRTAEHIALPEGDAFSLEYVTQKPWSGYNWYKGNGRSLIQMNVDFPIPIDRAVDLACHEGYPGHHVYNSLLEQYLVRGRGWMEFSVYALFSPQSLIAEGTANFGIEMAFPGKTRVEFEKEVLFPLAGLTPAEAEQYYEVHALVQRLAYAGNEAARRYLNGVISREEAARWLQQYALMSPERSIQRTKFFDAYRSYVINYNLGQDLVRGYIEAQGGTSDNPGRRWQIFAELLSSPRMPSQLHSVT